jgi:endonuclease/exonuclease/phosphatase family metal-dependent hydrolase
MKKHVFGLLVLMICQQTSAQDLSAMSFNIRFDNPNDNLNQWSERKADVVSVLKNYKPSFFGIQEGLINQLEYIDENMRGYQYIGVGRDDGRQKGEYTAIFYDSTRFSLVHEITFWLSKTPDKISIGWDAQMLRICTYGHFIDNNTGKNIYVFNTHYDHIGKKSRKNSSKLLLNTFKNLGISDSCLIIMGDFNSLPEEKPIKILANNLDLPIKSKNKPIQGPKGTFNGFDPTVIPIKRIDYVFSKNLSVKLYMHINAKRNNGLCVSDHLPVLIEYNQWEY